MCKTMDVITHSFPNFKASLITLSFMLWVQLFIHAPNAVFEASFYLGNQPYRYICYMAIFV